MIRGEYRATSAVRASNNEKQKGDLVSDGKFPYIMKLCFSSSRTIPTNFPPSTGSGATSNSAGNGHVKMQQDSE